MRARGGSVTAPFRGIATDESACAAALAEALLGFLEALIRRYVVLTPQQSGALALWVLHTWAVEAAQTTPYVHLCSAEPESGKSRCVEVLAEIVREPLRASSMTAAVLFRAVQQYEPTLLVDEIDNTFRDRNEKTELLGLFNDGYRRGGVALRWAALTATSCSGSPRSVRRCLQGWMSCRGRWRLG